MARKAKPTYHKNKKKVDQNLKRFGQQLVQEHMNARMNLLKQCVEIDNTEVFNEIWELCMNTDYPDRINLIILATAHLKSVTIPETPESIVNAAKKSLELLEIDYETFFQKNDDGKGQIIK